MGELESTSMPTLAERALALPMFPKPIRDGEPHPGWRDGIYTDSRGITWNLTPCVYPGGKWMPDLGTGSVLGLLILLARYELGDPQLSTVADGNEWIARSPTATYGYGATEVEALIHALEKRADTEVERRERAELARLLAKYPDAKEKA